MSEPTNPLFEEEKEFLERKKLEYERALRGDVEHIKEQTVHVGKLALVGAGVAGGIWLLTKAFGRRKPKAWHYDEHEGDERDDQDYSGFGDDGYEADDEVDQKWNANLYFDQEPHGYDESDENEEEYPTPALAGEDDALDDNGLSEFPDFAPHSSSQHGTNEASDHDYYQAPADAPHLEVYHTDVQEDTSSAQSAESRRFQSPEYSHPTANLPYDDSRRLPASNSFTDVAPVEESTPAPPKTKKSTLIPAIMSFLQSETGKVIAAQVAAVAMAMVTKAVKDVLPSSSADETPKSSDLAASTTAAGSHPYGQPAAKVALQSPVLDAHDPDASTSSPPLA